MFSFLFGSDESSRFEDLAKRVAILEQHAQKLQALEKSFSSLRSSPTSVSSSSSVLSSSSQPITWNPSGSPPISEKPLDDLELRIIALEQLNLEHRIKLLSSALHHLQAPISHPISAGHSFPPSLVPDGGSCIEIVFSEEFPSIPSADQLFRQFRIAFSSLLPSFQVELCASYTTALRTIPRKTSILYICFTTGVRYHHDLPPTLGSDAQKRKIFLVSLFSGCMTTTSAKWDAEISPFVYDVFVDETKGIQFDTTDPNEYLRLNENSSTLRRLSSKIRESQTSDFSA